MSGQNVNVCDIGDDVKNVLKKFRFQKHNSNSALILKVCFKLINRKRARQDVINDVIMFTKEQVLNLIRDFDVLYCLN